MATLSAARDRARLTQCHTIVVKQGRYRLSASVDLDRRDSGLTIQAANGAHPVLLGGVDISLDVVSPCHDEAILDRIIDESARSKVMEVDLGALGIEKPAPITSRGFGRPPGPAPAELFFDGHPGTLARWPNTGYAKTGKVLEPGNGENDQDKPKRQPVFLAGERAKQWAKAEDPWMYGYWFFDWADESLPVAKIDGETGAITLASPHVYGVAADKPFYVENLVEELDQAGEYVVDRGRQKLYFVDRPGTTTHTLSTLAQPLIAVSSASKITIRGLTFGVSRGDGLSVKDCDSVRIEGCRFDSLGGRGAEITGCHRCGLQSCDIAHTGEGGVVLYGGDRATLVAGENFVDNCDIGDYERRSQTYRPAVLIGGVGNIVSHCRMHDAPHSAIIYGGNNHVIEFNEFAKTISLTGDGGVVYTGRDWTARGTAIRYNWFHDNIGERKWEPAIYVDDQGSGIKMIGNLIERCHWGFLIGGGRDNVLEHNVLVDCDLAFDCDARGLGWAARSRPTMETNLKAVPYQSAIWRSSYPTLPNILAEDPMSPTGNIISYNLLIRAGKVEQQMEGPFRKTVLLKGNLETNSEAAISKYLPVPKSKMGLRKDRLRAQLPTEAGSK